MPRFFLPPEALSGQTACLTGPDADHIRVLRLRPGDEVTLCDGNGIDYAAHLIGCASGTAQLELLSRVPSPGEPRTRCKILAGLPKGERSDYIVQKCTENGAAEILFFLSARCVARPEPKSLPRKLERGQRIAEEAAKQSGRGIIPRVSILPDLAVAFNKALATDLPLFLYETGERETLRSALESVASPASAAIITGPEGGFEPYEAELAARMRLHICSMGPRIFRCETAPVAALAALMYATDNF